MGAAVELLKNVYRSVVPESVRDSDIVVKLKERLLGHNWIYDANYYERKVEGPAVRSARTVATSVVNDFKPMSVIDVGCGTGALLQALRERGCEVSGLEYAEAALRYCRQRQLDVAKFDLESSVYQEGRTFDVAVSMEVAEHLPERVADRYVDLLARLSPVVVFTAAPPGQGGEDHVNEQPPSYWITKFRRRGFEHDSELSERWRQTWKAAGDVESWYFNNLMIFRRACAT